MKTVLAILLAVFATVAHADWQNAEEPFDGSYKMADRVVVEWVTTPNIVATCEAESRKRGNNGFGYAMQACSFWTKQPSGGYVCTIYTKKNPTIHTMGHEIRHCFQGNYH